MKNWREIAVAVGLILFAFTFWMWLESHDAAIKAQSEVAILKAQRSEVKQETAQKVETVKQERQTATTPQKQVEYIERYVPVHITSLPIVAGQPPDAPSAVIAQNELPKLADYVAQCETCKVERTGLQKELKLCDEQVKALESGRKTTFWNRAKWFVIGGTVGIAAGYAASR